MNWQGQAVADTMRAVAIPVSVTIAAISLRVAVDRTYRSKTQLFRFLGLGVLTTGLAFGQYHALGKPPFWPALVLVWVGLILSAIGTVPLALDHHRSASLKTVIPEEHHD